MNTNRGWRPALAASLCAVLFPGGYLGSYFALADNSGQLEMPSDGCCYMHQYRYGGQLAEAIYWPAHYIDVKLRPTHWGVDQQQH